MCMLISILRYEGLSQLGVKVDSFIDGEMQSRVIWADLRNKRTPTKGTQNHVIELCGGLLWSGAG